MKKFFTSLKHGFLITLKGFKTWWKIDPAIYICATLYSVFTALAPYGLLYFSARLINELSGPKEPGAVTYWITIILISTASLAIIRALLEKWRNYNQETIFYKLNHHYTKKLLSMDFASIDNPKVHDLLSQIRQKETWGDWGLSGLAYSYYEQLLTSLLKIIGAIVLGASLFALPVPQHAGSIRIMNHPLFIILFFLVMAAFALLAPMLMNKAHRIWAQSNNSMRLGNRLFMYYGMFALNNRQQALDIRLYRQDILAKQNFNQPTSYSPNGPLATYAKKKGGFLAAGSGAVSQLFTGGAYLFVCLKAWSGAFGLGSVTQYIGAITSLSSGISDFLRTISALNSNVPFLEDVFTFLNLPNHMYQGSLTVEKRSDRQYEIEFKNVSFAYPGSNNYVLKNISLAFKVGSRLAIVGENGSGKTTFIKLLCRLYDPSEGEILLNGINIQKYDYKEYLSIFSVVFQDFQLLPFTLGQNVAAASVYNRKRVQECLKEARFGHRFDVLSQGLDTYLYKDFCPHGVEVSGGEGQKIAIARALYKDAPFIVLDEPTAALDPVAEFEIYQQFNNLIADKTAIYISHRLSSCRFCDDILVFHQGKIIQQGDHPTLVRQESQKYAQLWQAQAQYYQESNLAPDDMKKLIH